MVLGMLIRCLAGGVLDKWRQFKVECVWHLYDLRVQSSDAIGLGSKRTSSGATSESAHGPDDNSTQSQTHN